MPPRRLVRDHALVDALETRPASTYQGKLWRAVRGDRDPLRASAAGGRWDDATFEVLYTSAEPDGAAAELHFHVMRGQPIFPSLAQFRLYELTVALSGALSLGGLDEFAGLGVETSGYGALDYGRRQDEYSRTQEIAEVAHFLQFEALVVPNARGPCLNVVLFADRLPPAAVTVSKDLGPIDWTAWQARSGEKRRS